MYSRYFENLRVDIDDFFLINVRRNSSGQIHFWLFSNFYYNQIKNLNQIRGDITPKVENHLQLQT